MIVKLLGSCCQAPWWLPSYLVVAELLSGYIGIFVFTFKEKIDILSLARYVPQNRNYQTRVECHTA